MRKYTGKTYRFSTSKNGVRVRTSGRISSTGKIRGRYSISGKGKTIRGTF